MFHRKLDRQQPGKPIAARTLNRIMDLLEKIANIRVSPPLAMTDTASGPFIYLSSQLVNIAWGSTGSGFSAATTSGGFPVPASQSVQLYKIAPGNPPVFTNWQTVTAWNPYSSGSIASSKTALFGQTTDGTWWVITADC